MFTICLAETALIKMFLFGLLQTLEEASIWRLLHPSSMVEEMSLLLPVQKLVSFPLFTTAVAVLLLYERNKIVLLINNPLLTQVTL